MRKSPRTRRLMADHRAIQKLAAESSIFEFEANGTPPEVYRVTFQGVGVWRSGQTEINLRNDHVVVIELGAAYPRMMPSLSWHSPIFHPNISSGGVVCLGGYGTHWVPSLTLDELCIMLWDMIRFQNYDTESPYNRDAALWAKNQTQFSLPVDNRSLRDLVSFKAKLGDQQTSSSPPVVVSMGNDDEDIQIIEAEVIEPDGEDIVFID